jgi:hypothetical protein
MWNWLKRRMKDEPLNGGEERLLDVVDRLESLGNDIEERNRILAQSTPQVGLYETFQVSTGRGEVDVVIYDLEMTTDPNGRPKLVSGRIMDRGQFDRMLSPQTITRAGQS